MASFTIASGTTVTSTLVYTADAFTLTNLGVVTVASGHGVSLPGTNDVLLNQGAISGSNAGVYIGTGGSITNKTGGTISGASIGIVFRDTGSLTNAAGATVLGTRGIAAEGVATIVNDGSIGSTTGNGLGIAFYAGGSVTNRSGAVITGSNAINSGSPVTIDNSGSIAATTDNGLNIAGGVIINRAGGVIAGGIDNFAQRGINLFGPGSVTNKAGAVITGGQGVVASSLATIDNSGTIISSIDGGNGVILGVGGTLSNHATGLIYGTNVIQAGGVATIDNDGTIGSPAGGGGNGVMLLAGGTLGNHAAGLIYGDRAVLAVGGAATIINAGSIRGNSFAALFLSGYAHRVVVDPGGTFTGTVNGGNTLGSSIASTLELASGSSAGTLSGLGTQFVNFAQVTIDTGASWTLTGTNSVLAGGTLSNAGTLSNSGTLTVAGTLSNAAGIAGSAGAKGGSNTAGGAGTVALTLTSGGSLGNSGTIAGGAGGASVQANNNNRIGGAGAIGVSLTGGSLTNSASIAGGAGGAGAGSVNNTTGGGTGGTGGAGVSVAATASGAGLTNTGAATIEGGSGGDGGGKGGAGGDAGAGVDLGGGSLDNAGTIAGGAAGAGGGSSVTGKGGSGGAGGTGVKIVSGASLGGSGRITGGAGGAGGGGSGTTAGAGGVGGIAIDLGAASLTNAGLAVGGIGGTGGFGNTGTATPALGGAGGAGISISGGTLLNAGTIQGGGGGSGGYGTSAAGAAGGTGGAGVSIATGRLTNAAGGMISGGAGGSGGTGTVAGIAGAGGVGVSFTAGGTLANAGTISGSGGAAAVDFGTGASRLILYPQAVFTGAVTAAATVTNVLELAGSNGTLSSLGAASVRFGTTTITNFSQITIDSGAYWALSGSNSLSSGMALTNAGTLELAGTLANSSTFSNTGTLMGSGLVTGTIAGSGAVIAHGGTLHLTAALAVAAALGIDAGATLELGGAAGAAQTVRFDTTGAPATLLLDDPGNFAATIGMADAGDSIVVNPADAVLTAATLDATGHVLTLTGSLAGGPVGAIGTLAFAGKLLPGGFSVADNAVTLTQDVACFLPGTAILTGQGEVPIEDLIIGDRLVTRFAGLAPIKWIGYRHLDLTRHPDPEAACPILIRAGALCDGVPARDLRVSPEHAMFIAGGLVPARLLVNGGSILREAATRCVTYYHVELDSHDLLLAEGAAVESYLDTGNRGMFDNADEPVLLHPRFADGQAGRSGRSCAPLFDQPSVVKPIWLGLAERSVALGYDLPEPPEMTPDPDLRVRLGERLLDPVLRQADRATFILPGGTEAIRLVSRATAPSSIHPWRTDRRRLGVAVRRITLCGGRAVREDIPVDDPALADGWWTPEQDGQAQWRWTNGSAELRIGRDGPTLLEVEFGTMDAYVVAPPVTGEDRARPAARRRDPHCA